MRFAILILSGVLSGVLPVAAPAAALTPYRVADINPVTKSQGSFPAVLGTLRGRAIFVTSAKGEIWSTDGTAARTIQLGEGFASGVVANTGKVMYIGTFAIEDNSGVERLGVTDGTVAGTLPLLGDFSPLAFGSAFGEDFAAVPGTRRLFFTFYDSIHGRELWTSDGTVAGTHLALDLWPGEESGLRGDRQSLTVFRGKAYFSGDDGLGPALWASDGTASGTQRILGFGVSDNRYLNSLIFFAPLGNRLLFVPSTVASGPGPWVTDGTVAGTSRLNESSVASKFHIAGSLAYYAAYTDSEGLELWRTDGTPAGTFRLTDFPGQDPFPLDNFVVLPMVTVGGRVAFKAEDGVHGYEPWTTDGTVAGTRLIKDVCPGSCSGAVRDFAAAGGRLYFEGRTGEEEPNAEPSVSNLTAAGTFRLKDLCPGNCSSQPVGFYAAGDFVYFAAFGSLWRTNGRVSSTLRLTDSALQFGFGGTALGNDLLFSKTESVHGWELWRSDGSRTGTRLLADLPDPDLGGSMPQSFMKAGAKSFFFVNDGEGGFELWTSDGTAGGTRLVRAMVEGLGPASPKVPLASADASGRLVFLLEGGLAPHALWGSDGTADGTVRLLDEGIFPREDFRVVGSKLYFIAHDATHGTEPWVTDGTKSGTFLLRDTVPGPDPIGYDVAPLAELKGRLLFGSLNLYDLSGYSHWLSDGTPAGTVPIGSVYPFLMAPLAELSSDLVKTGDKIYFDRGSRGEEGSRFWVTDLTEAGTREIGAISSERGFRVKALFTAGGKIFISASSADVDEGLWVSDGQPGGALLLGRIVLDLDSDLGRPMAFGGMLFFGAGLEPSGFDSSLWVSNGTVGGTRQVQNPAGTPILDPRTLVVFGNQLICSNANEIWRTRGTMASTTRLLKRSALLSQLIPLDLVVAGTRLYFANMDDETGTELWAFRP